MEYYPLVILAVGMVVVVGSILALRLPAFLALIIAAMVVGYMTTDENIRQYAEGAVGQMVSKGELESEKKTAKEEEITNELVQQSTMDRVVNGFGRACTQIGILIAMAALVGKCLIDSGAADRIVRSALKFVGEARAPIALAGSGYLLSIPVFFDTVFYLLLPLAKATRIRTKKNYLFYVMAICAGGTVTHSLVPPTPGPLIAADIIGVDIGALMLAGCCVAICSCSAGLTYAFFCNRNYELPLRVTDNTSLEELEELANRPDKDLPPLVLALAPIILPIILIGGTTVLNNTLTMQALDKYDANKNGVLEAKELDTLGVEVYRVEARNEPLASEIIQVFDQDENEKLDEAELKTIGEQLQKNTFLRVAYLLGDRNLALTIAAGIALLTLVVYQRPEKHKLAASMESALTSAGTIILITAAGGAFGAVLQQTGIGVVIGNLALEYTLPIVPLGWALTSLVRTAQGSATVAIITSASIMASVNAGLGDAAIDPLWLTLAVGTGAAPISWMNDSGFWVVGKMSGMTESETLRFWTPMLAIMGVTGGTVVWILSTIFPHVTT